jgi:hypothetical protein
MNQNLFCPTDFLKWFRCSFTAPSYQYFCYFIQFLMGIEKEGFVTNVYLSSKSKKHWTNFHRFLSSYKWSPSDISKKLMELMFQIIKSGNGGKRTDIIGVIDDTPIEKQGTKFFGVDWHHKPYNNKKEKTIWANCWVCFGLLFKFGKSWLFFPISALLYVRKKNIKIAGEFKTKLELGVQLIEELELPEWVHLILITDGFYGPKKNFTMKLLGKGIDIISRLRNDAAVYENYIQETKKNVDVQKSMVIELI